MATETLTELQEKASAAAKLAREIAEMSQSYAEQLGSLAGAAAHGATGGAVDPFIFELAIFALAVFVEIGRAHV